MAHGVRQSVKSPSCIGLRSTALVLIALKNIKNGGFLFTPSRAVHQAYFEPDRAPWPLRSPGGTSYAGEPAPAQRRRLRVPGGLLWAGKAARAEFGGQPGVEPAPAPAPATRHRRDQLPHT